MIEATEVQRVDESNFVHDVPVANVIPEPPAEDGFIVELDESHVVSSAIN